MNDPDTEYRWWRTTAGKVGILAAAAAVIAALVPTVLTFAFSGRDSKTAAEEVRACMTLHKMQESSDVVRASMSGDLAKTLPEGKSKPEFRLFRSCEWPPRDWTQPDGYTPIRVMTVDNEFSDLTFESGIVDRFFSHCRTLAADYTYTYMGGRAEQTFTFEPGEMFIASRDEAVPLETHYEELNFALYPNEAIVVHGSKHKLDTVRCIG
jgi:hypothetical protein